MNRSDSSAFGTHRFWDRSTPFNAQLQREPIVVNSTVNGGALSRLAAWSDLRYNRPPHEPKAENRRVVRELLTSELP